MESISLHKTTTWIHTHFHPETKLSSVIKYRYPLTITYHRCIYIALTDHRCMVTIFTTFHFFWVSSWHFHTNGFNILRIDSDNVKCIISSFPRLPTQVKPHRRFRASCQFCTLIWAHPHIWSCQYSGVSLYMYLHVCCFQGEDPWERHEGWRPRVPRFSRTSWWLCRKNEEPHSPLISESQRLCQPSQLNCSLLIFCIWRLNERTSVCKFCV